MISGKYFALVLGLSVVSLGAAVASAIAIKRKRCKYKTATLKDLYEDNVCELDIFK